VMVIVRLLVAKIVGYGLGKANSPCSK